MSFGWSARDIVKCVELIVRVSKGLRDSTGAAAQYQTAISFLDGLKTTLDKLKEHLEAYPNTFHGKDLNEQAERLKTAVENFKVEAGIFEASLGSASTKSSLRRAPKKIQWTLFADSITDLQMAISQPQNVLNTILLLQTLKSAEQASVTFSLSQQELDKIALSAVDTLPTQLATAVNEMRETFTQSFESLAEKRQKENLERREEIHKIRKSIDEYSERFTNLEMVLKAQQHSMLKALESCIRLHFDSMFEGLQYYNESACQTTEAEVARLQYNCMEIGSSTQGLVSGMVFGSSSALPILHPLLESGGIEPNFYLLTFGSFFVSSILFTVFHAPEIALYGHYSLAGSFVVVTVALLSQSSSLEELGLYIPVWVAVTLIFTVHFVPWIKYQQSGIAGIQESAPWHHIRAPHDGIPDIDCCALN